MTTQVGINGFGRIGRCALRSVFENGSDVEWVGINDLAGTETLAHLLRHDTVYGPFPGEVQVADDQLVVNGTVIPVFHLPRPDEIPWSSSFGRGRSRVHREVQEP